ncbi:hypothetical protein D3C80_1555300 [compost metagenome]
MHQNSGVRVQTFHSGQGLRFKLVMDDTGALPAQYIRPRLLTDVIPKVAVRRPDDFFPQTIKVFNQLHRDTGCHYPIGSGFYGRGGISVDHNGAVGVLITKI